MRISDWSSDVCSSDLVGAEKAVDLPPPDRQRQVVDHALVPEGLAQPFDVDDDLGRGVHRPCAGAGAGRTVIGCTVIGCTVIGCPGASPSAAPSGRASTRKTSLARSSIEKITGGVNSTSGA